MYRLLWPSNSGTELRSRAISIEDPSRDTRNGLLRRTAQSSVRKRRSAIDGQSYIADQCEWNFKKHRDPRAGNLDRIVLDKTGSLGTSISRSNEIPIRELAAENVFLGNRVLSVKMLPVKDIPEPLSRIRILIDQKRYRIRIHAVQHMIKEGFSENDILGVIQSGRLLENHVEEQRCLILGSFASGEPGIIPLHVLCDYSNNDIADIVTAYIPQKPWWRTETKRGRVQ